MHETYWGLKSRVFGEPLDPAGFYRAATHEEALARLDFLLHERCRLGLLVGERGSGKSITLAVTAAGARNKRHAVVAIPCTHLEPAEFLSRIVEVWGVNPDTDWTSSRLWQALRT